MTSQCRRSYRAVPTLILAVGALLAALFTTTAPAQAASGSRSISVAHVQNNANVTFNKAAAPNLAQAAVFPNQIVFGWFNKISTDTSGEYSLNSVPSQVSLISIFDLNGMPQYDHNSAWWSAVTPQIDNLHAKGQKVLWEIWLNRAVLGSNGSPAYPLTAAGYAAFAQELSNEVTALHLDGTEVDIESGITLSTDQENIDVMNALSQYFGPKSTTGKILTMDTNLQGTSQPFNSTSGNYNYMIEQEYWKTSASLNTNWTTYAPYISPSQYIVTVDFEDGSGWSTQYGNPSQFANYADWNPSQGTKGGVGAYGLNYDYANCPAYHNVLDAYRRISGVTPPPYQANDANVNAIYTDGTTFSSSGGIDGKGSAYSSNLLGSSQSWNGNTVTVGPANSTDAWACKTISISTTSKYNQLNVLATGVNGNQTGQTFKVNYTDGSSTSITQSVSDWFTPQSYAGETKVSAMAYRDLSNGTKDNRTFSVYGYSFTIDGTKTVQSLTTPSNQSVVVLGYSLSNSTVPVSQSVSLTSAFNREGIVTDGTTFSSTGGIDGVGYAYSSNLLGSSTSFNSVTYNYGTANANNDVSAAGQVITLPAGQYSSLWMMATAVNGNQASQTFKVTYTDGTSTSFTQSVSDWFSPQSYAGELTAVTMSYRDTSSGTKDNRTFHLYNYSFALNNAKTVQSVTLPNNANVEVLSMTMVP